MKRERGGRRGPLKRKRGEDGGPGELGAPEQDSGPAAPPASGPEERASGIKKPLSAGFCRLCHGKFSSRNIRHAFGKVPVTGPSQEKQKRLDQVFFSDFKQLVGVTVRQDPELPQFVCKDCHAQFYKCRSVLRTFIQRVNTSPTDPHNNKSGKMCSPNGDSKDPCSDLITSSPECLHSLVSWTHSHAGGCPSVPNLQQVLSKQYCGIIRAVWGCGGGHDYVMEIDPDCAQPIKREVDKSAPKKTSSNRTHGISAKAVTAPSGYSIPDRIDTTPPLPDTGGAGNHSPQNRSPALPMDAHASPVNTQSSTVDTQVPSMDLQISAVDSQASTVETQTSPEGPQASTVDPNTSPESPQGSALGPQGPCGDPGGSTDDSQALSMEYHVSTRGARVSARGTRGARTSARGTRTSARGARSSTRGTRSSTRGTRSSARGPRASARGSRGARVLVGEAQSTSGDTHDSPMDIQDSAVGIKDFTEGSQDSSALGVQDSAVDNQVCSVDAQTSSICAGTEATNGQNSIPPSHSDRMTKDEASDVSNRASHSDVEDDDLGAAASSDDSFKPYTEKRIPQKKCEGKKPRKPRKQRKPRKIVNPPAPRERKKPGPKPGWKKIKGEREELPTIYKCHYPGCTAVYRGADGMKKHIKEHHEEVRERPCPHPGCNKVFMIDRYLQRHIKLIHTEERNYICDQCGQAFKQRKHLSVHQLRHTGAKPLQDFHSDVGEDNGEDDLSSDDSLILYPVERAPEEESEPKRKKQRKDPSERLKPGPKPGFRKKIKEEHEELPKIFRCHYPDCKAVYSYPDPMRKHIKELHEEVREHPCTHPGCNKVFMIDRYLQRHIKLIHTEERKYICDQCGQAFKQRKHLDVHQLRHTGAKPLQCEICGFQCRQRASLKFHMTKHKAEAELEFACKQCGKRFEKAHNLSVHMSMIHPLLQNAKKEPNVPPETGEQQSMNDPSKTVEGDTVDNPSGSVEEHTMDNPSGSVEEHTVDNPSGSVEGHTVDNANTGEGQKMGVPAGTILGQNMDNLAGTEEGESLDVPSTTVMGQIVGDPSAALQGQTTGDPSSTLVEQTIEGSLSTDEGNILDISSGSVEGQRVEAPLRTVELQVVDDPSGTGDGPLRTVELQIVEAPGTVLGQIVDAPLQTVELQVVEAPSGTVVGNLVDAPSGRIEQTMEAPTAPPGTAEDHPQSDTMEGQFTGPELAPANS